MVGNKSVNGLRIESVICSNPLKINTGNTVIFINVIHDILRVANFFLSEALGFTRLLAGFPCCKLEIIHVFSHNTALYPSLGTGDEKENKPQCPIPAIAEGRCLKAHVQGTIFYVRYCPGIDINQKEHESRAALLKQRGPQTSDLGSRGSSHVSTPAVLWSWGYS